MSKKKRKKFREYNGLWNLLRSLGRKVLVKHNITVKNVGTFCLYPFVYEKFCIDFELVLYNANMDKVDYDDKYID